MFETTQEEVPSNLVQEINLSDYEVVDTPEISTTPVVNAQEINMDDYDVVPVDNPETVSPDNNYEALPDYHTEVKGWDKFNTDIIGNIRENSIPANLIKYFTTSNEEYQAKNEKEAKELKRDTLYSIPALSQLKTSLDDLDYKREAEGTLSPEDEKTFDKLLEAYGNLYDSLSKSYDSGELSSNEGFSFSAIKQAFDTDPTGVLAEMANSLVADPELLVTPLGWKTAAARATTAVGKAAYGIAGSAALGGSITGLQDASAQLGETGSVDPVRTATSAAVGAVFAPVIIGTGKGIAKSVDVAGEKWIASHMDDYRAKVENRALDLINASKDRSMDTEAAVRRAIEEVRLPESVRTQFTPMRNWVDDYTITDETLDARRVALVEANNLWYNKGKKDLGKLGQAMDDLFEGITYNVNKISPKLAHAIRRNDMDEGLRIKSFDDIINDLSAVREKIPESRRFDGFSMRDEFDYLITNSRPEDLQALLIRLNVSDADKEVIRNVFTKLEEYKAEAQRYGFKFDEIDDYFPRAVKDYEQFLAKRGYEKSTFMEYAAKFINNRYKGADRQVSAVDLDFNKLNSLLERHTIDDLFNKFYRENPTPSIRGTSSHLKERTVRMNRAEWADYKDPIQVLRDYNLSMSRKLQTVKFFGGKLFDAEDAEVSTAKSIGKYVTDMYENGKITVTDQARLAEYLTSRFINGTKTPNKFVSDFKNITYVTLLANPLSAGTQLGDIGSAAYINGIAPTVEGMAKALNPKSPIDRNMMGLNNVSHEFEHLSTTGKILKTALKFGLFEGADALGKNTALNGSFVKYKGMVKGEKGEAQFRNQFKDAFEQDELDEVVTYLKSNNEITVDTPLPDDVKYLLWSDLSRIQPISLSEMPKAYLNNPNLRIMYMLKTYTLKQLDLLRREALDEMRRGNFGAGARNLTRLGLILGTANASVEEVKGYITGKDIDWVDRILPSLYRNYGISEYAMNNSDTASRFVYNTVAPPLNTVDDLVKLYQNLGRGEEERKLPYVSFNGWRKLFESPTIRSFVGVAPSDEYTNELERWEASLERNQLAAEEEEE